MVVYLVHDGDHVPVLDEHDKHTDLAIVDALLEVLIGVTQAGAELARGDKHQVVRLRHQVV